MDVIQSHILWYLATLTHGTWLRLVLPYHTLSSLQNYNTLKGRQRMLQYWSLNHITLMVILRLPHWINLEDFTVSTRVIGGINHDAINCILCLGLGNRDNISIHRIYELNDGIRVNRS